MNAPRVGVVDYRMGNLRSVEWALVRVGASVSWVRDPAGMEGLDVVLLPGVGAFPRGMAELQRMQLVAPIRRWVEHGRRLVGICLGFQLLFAASDEGEGAAGLQLLPGSVRRLPDAAAGGLRLKVPQIGWNRVDVRDDEPAQRLAAFAGRYFYFVHSYAAPHDVPAPRLVADYGGPFAAAVALGQVWGSQFHPERSGADGLEFLRRAVAAPV